MYAAQV